MAGDLERPYEPPLPFRTASSVVLGSVGFLSRSFLYALSNTETHGLHTLLDLLDQRKDETRRERGLITVSNHLSVLDDPLIWGVLPFKYHWTPNNMRWALGSYDICFKNGQNGVLSHFLTYGQTLPTQRLAYSVHGGLFQPTARECIRLLSDPHPTPGPTPATSIPTPNIPTTDPFTTGTLTYSTNTTDAFPSPSAYPSRRHSWLHIHPEGMIHQHPDKAMRYFKWGIARLILEAEPCPDVLPMWIEGLEEVMNEKRTWPRPIPRPGKNVRVSFGEVVSMEEVLEPFRERWRLLKNRRLGPSNEEGELGVVEDEELRYGPEAEQLRIEVTLAIRNEVLKVRRSRGFPDEDPKRSLAETWRREGRQSSGQQGEMKDRSVVKGM